MYSMFYQLLYIHLYRPFLKYTRTTSPLPTHISPRKFCSQAASSISKLFRLYKRTHGLRQICNIAIYIAHSACTIHLLNLPDKTAKRDIIHGLRHLEEMGECWTAARRTLRILYICATKWKIEIPEEAENTFTRARNKWGMTDAAPSPNSPPIMNTVARQISGPPVSDLMARNLQQQDMEQPISYNNLLAMSQMQGLGSGIAESPADTIDTRRSSGGLSLPPQSAADLTRNLHKMRASTQLTKAQQEAWNAHQARLKNSGNGSSSDITKTNSTANAAVLFGGIDTLMEESQDWWFKDQSQLASGFDNWTAPAADWSNLDIGVSNETNTSSNMNEGQFSYTNGGSTDFSPFDTYDYNNINGNGNKRSGGYGMDYEKPRQSQQLSYDDDIFY